MDLPRLLAAGWVRRAPIWIYSTPLYVEIPVRFPVGLRRFDWLERRRLHGALLLLRPLAAAEKLPRNSKSCCLLLRLLPLQHDARSHPTNNIVGDVL